MSRDAAQKLLETVIRRGGEQDQVLGEIQSMCAPDEFNEYRRDLRRDVQHHHEVSRADAADVEVAALHRPIRVTSSRPSAITPPINSQLGLSHALITLSHTASAQAWRPLVCDASNRMPSTINTAMKKIGIDDLRR
jgi:hypothetical protein